MFKNSQLVNFVFKNPRLLLYITSITFAFFSSFLIVQYDISVSGGSPVIPPKIHRYFWFMFCFEIFANCFGFWLLDRRTVVSFLPLQNPIPEIERLIRRVFGYAIRGLFFCYAYSILWANAGLRTPWVDWTLVFATYVWLFDSFRILCPTFAIRNRL
jgi:hypothetical protein